MASQASNLTVNEELLKQYQGTIPTHLAVIMDGNGRWATQRGLMRIKGHHQGANAVRTTVESCRYLGVEILTLYAFSSQNWGRPSGEVSGLMTLFDVYIKKERKRLLEHGIRLQVIGDRSRLSSKLQKAIASLEEESAVNEGMLLQVAVSYGGREELIHATREIARAVQAGTLQPDQIDQKIFADHLFTRGGPDPDLVIRTSGEFRISNFLLWQIAYSEFFITETLWPDFAEEDLLAAFEDFNTRQRRFGKTADQVSS